MVDRLEFILALAREEHFGRVAEVCRGKPATGRQSYHFNISRNIS
jgi:hypothetical protein